MFSSGCNLRYYKRENKWQNSTKTCRLYYDSNGNLCGYSYGQQIIKDIEGQYYFNWHKFSPTTSGHQWALKSKYDDKSSFYKIKGVSLPSLNNIRTKKELLDNMMDCNNLDDLNYNLEFFKENSSENDIKKYLEKIENEKKAIREHNSLERLRTNLKKVNYRTLSGLKKAIEKYKKLTNNLPFLNTLLINDISRLLESDITIKDLKENYKHNINYDYRDKITNRYEKITLENYKKTLDNLEMIEKYGLELHDSHKEILKDLRQLENSIKDLKEIF